jgi:hypothetical protein
MLRHLSRSRSLRAAFVFAAGGFGFAAGNVVLALVLPAAVFGLVALSLALNQFSLTIGTFGLEVIVNRHRPQIDRRFSAYLLSTATLTSALVAFGAGIYYRLSAVLVLLLFLMVIASTVNRVMAAAFQEDGRHTAALVLLQIHNYTLLLAAAAVGLAAPRSAEFVIGLVGFGYLCTAIWGWLRVRASMGERRRVGVRLLLREGAAILGLSGAVQTLFQFERLAIPKLGSMEMLATYAVLAAVAGSAFRMIQLGNAFTLLPSLRRAGSPVAAWSVIRSEAITAAAAAAGSSLLVLAGAPLVFHYLLRDKYPIGWALLGAMLAIGWARVWEGFSSTIVAALGDARRMAQLSALSGCSLAIALGGAILARSAGLLGILCAVQCAWLTLAAAGTWLARRCFEERFAAIHETPGEPAQP